MRKAARNTPCHHALAEAVHIAEDRKRWLFRTAQGEYVLRPCHEASDAWLMVRRRGSGGRHSRANRGRILAQDQVERIKL